MMKVFQINDYEWYMGGTLEEAVAAAMADSGLPEDEATDDPCEVDAEQMDKLVFVDDDGVTRRSFAAELQRRIEMGAKPGMFASTEY